MSFRFIHAADIHLDSPLSGLRKYDGCPEQEIRNASRRAFENLVRFAIDERVDFVVLAGDLYDGDWTDYNTGLFMTAHLAKLADSAIPVVLISGNHDAQNRMTKSLRLPAGVRQLNVNAPETVRLDDLPVSIHGQGFAEQAVTSNLARGYPAADSGRFNLGLLHTSATGRDGHERYAPCSLADLESKGYDYWALGHIHQREVLREADPVVAFSGNLQGRHVRETGAKGCLLVTVDDDFRSTIEFRALDVFRFADESLVLDAVETEDELLATAERTFGDLIEAAEGRPLAARLTLTGATPLHSQLAAEAERVENELRAVGLAIAPDRLWLQPLRVRTTPPLESEPMFGLEGPLGEVARLLEELKTDPESLAELDGLLQKVRSRQPAGLDAAALSETLDASAIDRVADALAGALTGSTSSSSSEA